MAAKPAKVVASGATSASAKAPAAKGSRGPSFAGLDDVPAIVRKVHGEADSAERRMILSGLHELARALGALGRSDLAESLLDLLPAAQHVLVRLPAEAAAGHDIDPLWASWLAAVEEQVRDEAGEVEERRLATALGVAIRGAREPARSQLVERARTRLERVKDTDGEERLLKLLMGAGALVGAQQLAEQLWAAQSKDHFVQDGPVAHLVLALLDSKQHGAALTLLPRLEPDAIVQVINDSKALGVPLEPAVRERLDRIIDALPADSAEEARSCLVSADTLATLIAGGTIEESPYDLGFVDDLLALGQLDVARRFMAVRPPSQSQPDRWAHVRFQLGLDDFDTALAALGKSESTMSNIDGWLDLIGLLLARDPHDKRIDQVWALVEKAMKKGPRTQYDRGVADKFVLRALATRADVAIARGEDVAPVLARVHDGNLLRTDRPECLRDTVKRWQRAGRPEEVEALAMKLTLKHRLAMASLAAGGFLPDLGRALGSLVKLAGADRQSFVTRLTALLDASAAAQADVTSTA